jgi:hypothetical protein
LAVKDTAEGFIPRFRNVPGWGTTGAMLRCIPPMSDYPRFLLSLQALTRGLKSSIHE